ncbi:ankyrin repeat [Fusarium albosuccineum]|uniref:Ankyrin repeat n=1 Tax=Fusarium albosuccineum TaxID=1237068 RepID=A0A8H4PJM7_9HYPO|nr:ankyrin repeat [Fusarium albosuccineum]
MTQPDGDSGYGGSSNSSLKAHDGNLDASSNAATCTNSPHPQPSSSTETDQPRPVRIRPIAKSIDKETARRASDVIEQMGQLLQEHMVKPKRRKLLPSKRNPPSMSVRSIMLGTTEQDAKTCLVIFCNDSHGSHDKIRDFLRKSFVKDLYQPNDITVPSFDVHIVGASPSTRAGAEIGIPLHPQLLDATIETLCGMPVYFTQENGDQKRLATMGGLLYIGSSGGEGGLFGLTVAHGAVDLTNLDDSDTSMSDEDDDYDDSSSELTTIENHPPAALTQIDWQLCLNPTAQENPAEHARLHDTKSAIEHIAFSALDDFQGGAFRHWALFRFPSEMIAPKQNTFGTTSLKIPARLENPDEEQWAIVLTSAYERKWEWAKLAPGLSRILLEPGTEFVQAYAVELLCSSDIRVGNSGSWVINPKTMEVYGHLVATDILSGSHVIPLVDILNDIGARFANVSIEFPCRFPSPRLNTAEYLASRYPASALVDALIHPASDSFGGEYYDDSESAAGTISTASRTGKSLSAFSAETSSTSATFSSADTKGKYPNDLDLDSTYGSARPAATRPPLWNNSQMRKLARLYAYTTLPLRKIIEVIYRKNPQSAPGLDSANKKLNALLNKNPRWLHARTEEDMDARMRELAQSSTHQNKERHNSSQDDSASANVFIGDESSARLSSIGHRSSQKPTTTTLDPSIQSILPEYSTGFIGSVEMLMSRYSLVEVSGGDLDLSDETMSQVAVSTRGSWIHDADAPVVLSSAKAIAGDYLKLDHFLEHQGFCGPGLAVHNNWSCFCYARDEVTTDDWITASGPTPNAWNILSSSATTVPISTFSLTDSFGNTALHLLAARDKTKEHLMRAIAVAPDSVLNMTNAASQTFLHVLGRFWFEDIASEGVAISMVLERLRLRSFDVTARDVYGRNFFHLLPAIVLDGLMMESFLLPHNRHAIARRDAFGVTPIGTRSNPIPLLDQYTSTESSENSPVTGHARLLLGIRTACSVPLLEDPYGRNGLHFLADAILSEGTLQHNVGFPSSGSSSKNSTGGSNLSRVITDSSSEMLSLRIGLVDELLAAGVDPNHYDNDGNTVLMVFAARLPEDDDFKLPCEIIRRLLGGGADINARNRRGETALHIAVRTGHNLAMRTLVEAG